MDKHEAEYTLVVSGKRIPVSQEVYKAYYQCRNREKYLEKLAERNNISLENDAKAGSFMEFQIVSAKNSMEDAVINRELIKKMKSCLSLLDNDERSLIKALYFENLSERQLSRRTGIAQRTINDHKRRVLSKLKELMEK